MRESSEMRGAAAGGRRLARLMLAVSAVFLVAGFVHLRADFPNGSPWADWAKMTDEGWYGSAAIQHFVMGRWYLPGSFNPAVAMPVWPAMLGGWFAMTGVSMLWARVLTMLVYAASVWLLYAVMRRAAGGTVAALTVLLTVANPFCYAFDRLAVLEPVTVFWMMLALWLAGRTGTRQYGRLVGLGVVICLLVLTKPTGIALVPAVLYMLWAGWGWPRRVVDWLGPMAVVVAVAAGLWLAYFEGVVRPCYLADYRLLFSINDYRVHLSILPKMAWVTLLDGQWVQPVLFPVAVGVVLLSLVRLRGLWRTPLFGTAVIAAVCHLAYIGYHTNFQPRYYLVLAMPMAVVVALGLAAAWKRRDGWGRFGLAVAVTATLVWMGARTLVYAWHPEYSYLTAAQSIATVVRAEGGPQPLLVSDSGADITLFTGLSAIDDGYTTEGLDALLERYHPGWYAAWPGWEDAAIRQMGARYRLDEVARYRIFDDPKRQTLVLYKLSARKP